MGGVSLNDTFGAVVMTSIDLGYALTVEQAQAAIQYVRTKDFKEREDFVRAPDEYLHELTAEGNP